MARAAARNVIMGNGVDSSSAAGSSCDEALTGKGQAISVGSVVEEGDGRGGPLADLVECRSASLGQSPFTEGGNERSADTRQHDVTYDSIQPGKYSHVSLHRFLWLATNASGHEFPVGTSTAAGVHAMPKVSWYERD